MPKHKIAAILFCLISSLAPLYPQKTGEFVSEGKGSGSNAAEAVEAAKVAAVKNLALSVIKRDSIYAELLVSEAFKNDWFHSVEDKRVAAGRWEAKASLSVDEGVLDALYYGRYSTTIGVLLDQAEASLAELEPLLADGGTRESNGDLGGAETAYRRAAAKADEALRLIGPVEDAVFFSSSGNRKAPELKAVIASLRTSALDGLGRIRASQDRLSVDVAFKAVLGLLDSVEAELAEFEKGADELRLIASTPKSYENERLSSALSRSRDSSESLRRRRAMLADRAASFTPEMEYPRVRVELLLDRIDSLSRRYAAVSSSIERERFRRSAVARAASAALFRAPKDVAALGVDLPFGVHPSSEGAESVRLPLRTDARLEGAFSTGSSGGIWCRSEASYGTDQAISSDSAEVLSQSVDVGLFRSGVFGIGFRWEWLRRYQSGAGEPIRAVALTFGSAGSRLGDRRSVPLWLTTFSWELPAFDDFVFAREVNFGVESVLRPSTNLRLEVSASSRVRTAPDGDAAHSATAAAGVCFRLPPLRPLLWRLSWEGSYRSPLDGSSVEWAEGEGSGAFRFGFEYSF